MLILGIETSCDESGAAIYDSARGLLAHALHSQVALHNPYGGVVPELASRDHVRRLLPLVRAVLHQSGARELDLDAVAYTRGPGLAGALLVSGGHTQLMRVEGVGDYEMLGETLDDAAGEAFDKTAKLLGLGYPGGPVLAKLAERGRRDRFAFPRPMLERLERSGDLDFSFSGLKTAVVTQLRKQPVDDALKADVAAAFQEAVAEVLVEKSRAAIERTGLDRLVVAGGVGANTRLRALLDRAAARDGFRVFYPAMEFCTDNGAMIALAGALRLRASPSTPSDYRFAIFPRWDLAAIAAPAR
jgi:N6-L-threonylcarbamoyladenine synthase